MFYNFSYVVFHIDTISYYLFITFLKLCIVIQLLLNKSFHKKRNLKLM